MGLLHEADFDLENVSRFPGHIRTSNHESFWSLLAGSVPVWVGWTGSLPL